MVTAYYRQFYDISFYCPIDLSSIYEYCKIKRTGKQEAPLSPEAEKKITRLVQLVLSIIPRVNEPYGKWIAIGSIFTLGGIKSTIGLRENGFSQGLTFKMKYMGTFEQRLMLLNVLGQLIGSHIICVLQSLHILAFQSYDLVTKPSFELLLETVSTALYISTFLPHHRTIGYLYQQAFLVSQVFLAGYCLIRATIQAYCNPALRTYNLLEASLNSLMLALRIHDLRSLHKTIQYRSKELEDRAVVVMGIPQKPCELQIVGQEHKRIDVITSQEGKLLVSQHAHQITVDEALNPYPTPRPIYPHRHHPDAASRKVLKPLALEYDKAVRERTIHAVKTHVAQPEKGSLKVLMLRPPDLETVKEHVLQNALEVSNWNYLPSNQNGAYALFTVRDGLWTLWENRTLPAT
jgi:hypothetical protein